MGITAVDLPAYRRGRRQMLHTLLVFALIAAAGFAAAPDFAEIKKEAEAGNANAQYNLGVM